MSKDLLKKLILKIINFFVSLIIVLIILAISYLMIQKHLYNDKIPDIFGFKILQVVSGSMSGEFEVNDTIIIRKVLKEEDIKIGDIVTFKEDNVLITHRIINKIENNEIIKYITKGDANNVKDNKKIMFKDIEGKYVCKIVLFGKIVAFAHTQIGMIFFASVPIVLAIFFIVTDKKRKIL